MLALGAEPTPLHTSTTDAVARSLDVDPTTGLSEDEAARRLAEHGPNALAEAPREPGWKRFLSQFREPLIMILLGAAVVSYVVSGELKTPAVVLLVVLLNAVVGFVQENRAEKSLDALRQMLVTQARVRRGGNLHLVPTDQVVPGDVVLVEAGDRVPADGRLSVASSLEIEEAALTGESLPVAKTADPVAEADVPLGDRRSMAYMNTTVTRGRGEMLVTATGMSTEIGRLAGLLNATPFEKTPLQRQLDHLAHGLAKLAGVIVVLMFAIGLIRGDDVGALFLTAVALAVASIPEGLPGVTAVTLAVGVHKLAKQHAIVKRLASVETLGSTSVICSDKTGTLTLNQMTARELVVQERRHRVSGGGYSTEGEIEHLGGDVPIALDTALTGMALCNDAEVRDGALVGDPTEGALVVLAAKGGIDVAEVRQRHPRLAEAPFDSATKYMATFHEMTDASGQPVVRMYVKGAPDVLFARSAWAVGEDGTAGPIAEALPRLEAAYEQMAAEGLRVLAVAERELDPAAFATHQAEGVDPADLVHDLTVVALAGIVDPPRPEVAVAIADAHAAGIEVKMITGDHATTAAAIGRELGLEGDAITGAELARMDDDELARRIDDIAVFARVAPEHKLRLVTALQQRGNVVAMTGDGVNDAPALKKADIGVAMGITGTEVTKEAATMVLTDDNFATIVGAVRQGRGIYANIVNFVRFQLSTTVGFAILFLLAALFDIANGKPFTAIAILWVNLIMDGPPAMALGVDPPEGDVMRRPPRPVDEPILTRSRWLRVAGAAIVMAAGTLAVLVWAPGPEAEAGTATVAGTMAFTTFVLFQLFNILNVRSEHQSVFSRRTLQNDKLWLALAGVLALQIAVVHLGPMQRLFDTTSLTATQWLVATLIASSVLWFEEARKAVSRSLTRKDLS